MSDRLLAAWVRTSEADEAKFVTDSNLFCNTGATISNPNTSEEAKERAKERLQEMEDSGELGSREAHEAQVKTGHKVRLLHWRRRVDHALIPVNCLGRHDQPECLQGG